MSQGFWRFLVLMLSFVPLQAQAATLTSFLGINSSIDEAIGKLQGLEDQTRDVAFAISDDVNSKISQRIDQVNGVVGGAIKDLSTLESTTNRHTQEFADKADEILKVRIQSISELESKFFSDLNASIQKAQCAVDTVTNYNFKDTLGYISLILGMHRIRVFPPPLGIKSEDFSDCFLGVFRCDKTYKSFEIKEPFSQTFDDIKSYLVDRLRKVTDDTPLSSIRETYEYIGVMCARAGCLTPGAEKTYNHDFVEYNAMARRLSDAIGTGE